MGVVTVDRAHLKLQGKIFYDFTLHCIEIREKTAFEEAIFVIRTETLLLVAGPSVPNTSNIRSAIADGLREKYEIDLDDFMKEFTMVTDGAEVMARVANASKSRELYNPS